MSEEANPTSRPIAKGLGSWWSMPRTLPRVDADRVHRWLVTAIDAQAQAVGKAVGEPALTSWFDPVARGGKLRDALDRLPDLPGRPAELAEPFVTSVGDERYLVTFEGHELARILRKELTGPGNQIRLRLTDTEASDGATSTWYRGLAFGKIRSVIELRAGVAAPLLPQAVGLVLLLLINGNVGAGQGLRRPESREDLHAVDEAVASMVSRFADELVPPTRRRTAGAYSLYGGYAISEARRRLGSDLLSDPVTLAQGSTGRVVKRLAEELARRSNLEWPRVDDALNAMATDYLLWRPRLAAYGLAQGTPIDIDGVLGSLRSEFDTARGTR